MQSPAFTFAQRLERGAEVVLCQRPVNRYTRSDIERVLKSGHCLLQPRRPGFTLAKHSERVAEIIRGSNELGAVMPPGQHPSRQFDGDGEGEVYPFCSAVLV